MSWVCTSRSWHIAIPWLLLGWAQQMQQAVPLLLSKYWLSIIISFKWLTCQICNKFETSSNHPASPTKANLWVPWPRLEPQVAESTRLRSGRYCKEMSTSAGNLLSSQNGALLVILWWPSATTPQGTKKKTRHHARPTLTNRDWPLCFLQFSALQRFVGEAMLASTQGWYWLQLTAGIQLWLP